MTAPDGRPGGWVEGIGWVAQLRDLSDGDTYNPPWLGLHVTFTPGDERPFGQRDVPVPITRWADGTEPAPPPVPGGLAHSCMNPAACVTCLAARPAPPAPTGDAERCAHCGLTAADPEASMCQIDGVSTGKLHDFRPAPTGDTEPLVCDRCGTIETDDAPFAVRGGQAGYYDYCTTGCEQATASPFSTRRPAPTGERPEHAITLRAMGMLHRQGLTINVDAFDEIADWIDNHRCDARSAHPVRPDGAVVVEYGRQFEDGEVIPSPMGYVADPRWLTCAQQPVRWVQRTVTVLRSPWVLLDAAAPPAPSPSPPEAGA